MSRSASFLDGGVFGPMGDMRLDEIGTVLSDISDRRYAIHGDDPLSARATMEQTAKFTRDDWDPKIECFAEQTATATDFHLTARIRCWSTGTPFLRPRRNLHDPPERHVRAMQDHDHPHGLPPHGPRDREHLDPDARRHAACRADLAARGCRGRSGARDP
jgi:hypothetical protein